MSMLVVIAICCVGLALVRSLQRPYRMSFTRQISNWTPPYAPHFETATVNQPAGSEFTPMAVSARRAAAKRISATDNTEFVPDLFAYRCKICSTLHAHWLSAFECHKG